MESKRRTNVTTILLPGPSPKVYYETEGDFLRECVLNTIRGKKLEHVVKHFESIGWIYSRDDRPGFFRHVFTCPEDRELKRIYRSIGTYAYCLWKESLGFARY